MTHVAPLCAIHFDRGNIDAFLRNVAVALTAQGARVCGVLQHRGDAAGDCHCADMDLVTIGSGRVFRISQPLGNGSRGCRLDAGALAECSAFLRRELDGPPDLLILNRFGRGEGEGRGFRDLIGLALERNVPVLTAVRPTYSDAWSEFSQGLACALPMDFAAVNTWFRAHSRAGQAA